MDESSYLRQLDRLSRHATDLTDLLYVPFNSVNIEIKFPINKYGKSVYSGVH